MINFKIFFEYSFKSSLDEIKKIILSPTPQIPQTIHNTLPNRITLQYDQVLLHQLVLTVTLVVDQLPHEVEVYLVVFGHPQGALLGGEKLV